MNLINTFGNIIPAICFIFKQNSSKKVVNPEDIAKKDDFINTRMLHTILTEAFIKSKAKANLDKKKVTDLDD